MEVIVHRNQPETELSTNQIDQLCKQVAAEIKLQAKSCAVIFVDDPTLTALHAKYLNDSEPTDIITFDLGENEVEGELYISKDRAQVQAQQYGVSMRDEIMRLIIHGLLHLKGYDDIEDEQRRTMKKMESSLLKIYSKKI